MFVFLLYECVHHPYNFFTVFSFCYQFSFCKRVMISCSIHGKDVLYSCKDFLLRSSSSLVEQSAYGLGIARVSSNLQIWSFCGKSNATNPHTCILFPVNICDFVHSPFSILEVLHPNTLLSLLHCDVHHGVEVDILEGESRNSVFCTSVIQEL